MQTLHTYFNLSRQWNGSPICESFQKKNTNFSVPNQFSAFNVCLVKKQTNGHLRIPRHWRHPAREVASNNTDTNSANSINNREQQKHYGIVIFTLTLEGSICKSFRVPESSDSQSQHTKIHYERPWCCLSQHGSFVHFEIQLFNLQYEVISRRLLFRRLNVLVNVLVSASRHQCFGCEADCSTSRHAELLLRPSIEC